MGNEPVCPECDGDDYAVELVYSAGGQFETGHSPWDEAGTAHRQADSKTVNYYRCSNGHRWTEQE